MNLVITITDKQEQLIMVILIISVVIFAVISRYNGWFGFGWFA